jgi:hypothetical protein
MLSKGEKVFIITRRLFDRDIRRHFVGEIQDVSGAVSRVQGYVFVYDEGTNDFIRRDKLRTCLFPLIDARILITVLPRETMLADVHYTSDKQHRRVITDEKTFSLNVNEFSINR